MFSISNVSACDFPSTWRSSAENQRLTAECQTDSIERKDVKIQVVKREHVEIQTGQNDPTSSSEPLTRQYDKPSLYAFLNKTTPIMIKELERNARTMAFRHLQQRTRQQQLEQLNVLEYQEASQDYAILSVAVSAFGNAEIAVGYGATQHTDWCDHPTKLVIFRHKDFSLRPKVFDMDSCVSSVTFNDRKAIVTCGMYTGEVLSWDGEEQLQVGGRHSGRVSSLQWRPIYEGKRLLSAGVDGAIKLWKIRDKALTVSEEFVVTSWDADVKLTSRSETPVGVTTTSFSVFDDTQFIIGTEGGYVMLGSLSASHALFENGAKKCVTMCFKRHQGHVTQCAFSPHSRNVFLTSSVDKRARIYTQLQPSPVISLVHSEQLVKALWSCGRQLQIVTANCSGVVAVFDIRKAYMPLAEINLARRITDLASVGLDQLAVSTDRGGLHLLQLSDGLLASTDHVGVDDVINSLQDGIGFE